MFDISKFPLIGVMAHLENLKKIKNHRSILRVFNNFSTVWVFGDSKNDIRDFCHAYTWFGSGDL